MKLGAVRWVSTERINKKLPKNKVAKSSYNSSSYLYNRSYGYSSNDDSDSWESVKEFFSFGADGRNHFTLGVDLGFGGGSINLPPIDFNIIERNIITPHSFYIKDEYSSGHFVMPINVRLGYLRDIGDNWAFSLNFLYNYMYVGSFETYDLETTTYLDIETDSKKLTSTIQRIGGEFVVYYKLRDWFHFYAGGGVLKDFGSKYKVSFEAYRSSYGNSIYINEKGQRRFELEQKIDSWYPLVKFGILWNFHNYIGSTSDVTCSWAVKEENYLGLNCGLVLGLQFKI